jgi:hypothetical protein
MCRRFNRLGRSALSEQSGDENIQPQDVDPVNHAESRQPHEES